MAAGGEGVRGMEGEQLETYRTTFGCAEREVSGAACWEWMEGWEGSGADQSVQWQRAVALGSPGGRSVLPV